jgi:hypothetical protein
LALISGAIFDRLFPKNSKWAMNLIYGAIAFGFVLLIFWSLLELLFGLPRLNTIVPVPAIFLGIVFAVGIKGAYITLKERDALKKEKRKN